MSPTGEDAVAAAQDAFGRHPGYRALHARGTLMKGTFTATTEAAALTRAAHMQGEPVPVTVRFSNGAGDPKVPDFAPDVRGMAIKLYLPDGSRTDIVAQTVPYFPVSTPEAFLELLRAQKRAPAMLWRLPMFLARHPGAGPRFARAAPALRPPVSYATVPYYAVHAFALLDGGGVSHHVRYTLVPEAGTERLSPRAAKQLGREYLQEEIRRRVADGPIRFTLELQVAAPEDPVDDPARDWPKDRRRVRAGTVELTGIDTERETGDDVLVFDPTRVTDGIELTADPVLRFRAPAYGASVAARTAR